APQDEDKPLMAPRKNLILDSPGSGRLEGRAAPIQAYPNTFTFSQELQDEARQVGVLRKRADALADISRVDRNGAAGRLVGGGEADLFKKPLQDRVQAAGADILHRCVDLLGQQCDLLDRVGVEIEFDPFGVEQRLVLLDEARFRLDQDALQVAAVERLQFDADRQPALQFGQEVGGFREVKGAR